jgi:hypothetical protein
VTREALFGDAASIATTVITLILLVNIVLAIITMFRERREPSSLWAWILVMFFVPLFGFLLWVFVGRRLTKDKIFAKLEGSGIDYAELTSEQSRALVTGTLVLSNDAARRNSPVVELLVSDGGARLSVEVLLFWDALGGRTISKSDTAELRAAGGKVAVFFKSRVPLINFRVNNRTHRKLAVRGTAVSSIQQRLLTDWNAAAAPADRVAWRDGYFIEPAEAGLDPVAVLDAGLRRPRRAQDRRSLRPGRATDDPGQARPSARLPGDVELRRRAGRRRGADLHLPQRLPARKTVLVDHEMGSVGTANTPLL